jgi:transcriptional regulator with XRE-family HTH domain
MSAPPPFARAVAEAMTRRGLGLRELCRRAGVDPSLLSKMLSGKRPPPSDQETLARLARALELDVVELVVAAGVLPAQWDALRRDPSLLRAVHRLASGAAAPAAPAAPNAPRSRPVEKPRGLSEELL